jgi:uncharacterized membrane protein YqaE (UPF0057 family)
MKKTLLFAAFLCSLQFSFAAFPSSLDSSKSKPAVNMQNMTQQQQRMLMEQFTKMSVKDYETVTGKKMNLLEKLSFKFTQQQMKRELKKQSGSDASTNTLLLVILAILLPPLAVYLHENALNGKFWLSVLLTLLFWLPGVIYALIVVLN